MDQLEAEVRSQRRDCAAGAESAHFRKIPQRNSTQAYMKQRSILLWNNRMKWNSEWRRAKFYQTAVLWRAMAQGMAGGEKEEKLSARI